MSDRVTPYEKTTWVNSPSTSSPINASNLNHMETGIKNVTDALNDLEIIVPPATQNDLGTVKVGSRLSIAQDGTLSANDQSYTLPAATQNSLGGVKVGSNLNVAQDGTLSAPDLPKASTSQLGGIKVGNHLTIAQDGTLNADDQGGTYTLPPATGSTLGGIIVGDNLSIDENGRLSALGGGSVSSSNADIPDILKEFRETPILTIVDQTKIGSTATIATGLSLTVNADGSFTVNGESSVSSIVMDLDDFDDIWSLATLANTEECYFAVAAKGSGVRGEVYKTTYEHSGPSSYTSHDVISALDNGVIASTNKLVSNGATSPSIEIDKLYIYFETNVEYDNVRVFPRFLTPTNDNPQIYYNSILFEKIRNIIPEKEDDHPLYSSNATMTSYLLNSGYFGVSEFNEPPGGSIYFNIDELFPDIVSDMDTQIPANCYFYAGFDGPMKGVYVDLLDQYGNIILTDDGTYNHENSYSGENPGEFSHIRLYITSGHDDITNLKIKPQFIKYVYEHSTQELPIATPSQLGVIKIGDNLTIQEDGTLSADAHPVGIATTSSLGTVKIGSRLSIAQDGTLSANDQSYTLPTAAASTKGGVMIGDDIAIDSNGKISADLFRILTPVMTANNAPSGEAIASSEYSTSYKAYYAFTQATTSGNGWRATDNTVAGAWIGYHFETPVCVKRVVTYNASVSAPKRFKIQASNDGITWDDLAEGSNPSNSTSAKLTFSFANNLYYSYYRLYILEGYSTSSVGIRSVNFYKVIDSLGSNPSDDYEQYVKVTPNMTSDTAPTGYTITYSSRYSSSYSGYRAFDGNTASGYEWYSAQNDVVGAWVACQLPSAVIVKKLAIYNRNNSTPYAMKQFKLQGSNDGTTWTDIDTYNIASNTQALRSVFTVNNTTAYNRYRIYVVEGWASNYVAIAEIELYSEETVRGVYATDSEIAELFETNPTLPQANREVGIKQLSEYDTLIKQYIGGGGGGGGGYVLPTATDSRLGGIKVGSGLTVQNDGTLSASGGGAQSLDDLDDVDIAGHNLYDGMTLRYDDTGEDFKPAYINISDLGDVDSSNLATGDILEYDNTYRTWYPRQHKAIDLIYSSGGLNTYAQAENYIPFTANWPNLKEIDYYDELAIMIGFTDVTYTNENFLEARFNVRLYEQFAPNWKASSFKDIPLLFNDDPANDGRMIKFGLTMFNNIHGQIFEYDFRYQHNYTTSRIPGIRKIYGLKY